LVANAGNCTSAPLEETTVELWRKNYNVLCGGVLPRGARRVSLDEAAAGRLDHFHRFEKRIAAALDASAYSSAKAAALHLARCLALEGAPFRHPGQHRESDAVIKGSRIWDGDWRRERAGVHGIDSGEALEAHYRNRSIVEGRRAAERYRGRRVFFASDMSIKSTGNMINVDAGNAQAFTR